MSTIVMDATRLLIAVGVNVTLIVQVPPFAATGVPRHVLVSAKSPALPPVTATLVIFKLAFPVLVTEIVSGVLATP